MFRTTLALGTAIIVASPAAAVTQAQLGLQAMRELNAIVLTDMTVQGGETEGKLYVGRDLGGNSHQVGFGSSANAGQGLAASARSTLTVGRNVTSNVNLNNGSNGGNGTIGSFGNTNVYGAVIGGNLQSMNMNGQGGTLRVGGSTGQVNYSNGGVSAFITSNANSNIDLRDNMSIWIGGSVGQLQGGNNTSVKVNGNVGNLGFGSGGVAQIGGNLSQLSGSNNQNISVVGNISNFGNAGGGSTIKAGGSINNLNGSNGVTAYAGGSISGNTNGASFNPNTVWSLGNPPPAVPGAPLAPDQNAETAALRAQLQALSSELLGLTLPGNPSTVSWTGGTQRATFNAIDNGAGFALFNVDASIFNAQEFAYNIGNVNLPVIVNVTGSSSYTMNANFINNANVFNQSVIWNFGNASQITLNRKFQGSLLAPNATVTTQLFEGTLVADNLIQRDEIHLGAYARGGSFLTTPPAPGVPEPASWALLIAGFSLTGLAMRRRNSVFAR